MRNGELARTKKEETKPVMEAPQQPEEVIGVVESLNAMMAELNDQNSGLRNRAVQLAGELAKAKAVIAARDATIRDLHALQKKN